MFSGIVEECARVTGIVKEQENVHFTLHRHWKLQG